MINITILGSCRQESINKHFKTTNIKEGLTYPHYTKEIIQAIEFCKGISNISIENSKICFRTGILENKQLDWRTFKSEFDTTDVFVIEIASRLSYEWNNMYLHHIQTEAAYNFKYSKEIIVRDLTDSEIEEDIKHIKHLLDPKPVIVISHISTYTHGKRYALIKLLEDICHRLNIPFYNPSTLLNEYSSDLILANEKVIAHYTNFGHEVIGCIYKDIIDSVTIKD